MKFNKQFLDPIPIPDFRSGSKELSRIARSIERMNSLIEAQGGLNDRHLQSARNDLLKELNELVLSLYQLNESELRIVNSLSQEKY